LYKRSYGPGEKFKFSASLFFIQSLANFLFAVVVAKVVSILNKNQTTPEENTKTYFPRGMRSDTPAMSNSYKFFLLSVTGLFQVLSGFLSNKSLEYLSLTSKSIFKSIKPVPIIFFGSLMGHKYHLSRRIGVVFLSVGIIPFMAFNANPSIVSASTDWWFWGIFCALPAVMMDGIVGSVQDEITKKYKPSSSQLSYHVHIWGIILFGAYMILSGEVLLVLEFIRKYPEVLWRLLMLSVATPIGNLFIFSTIVQFGAVKCSIVTTLRKLSVLFLFGIGSTTLIQWIAVGGVILGVCLDIYGGNKDKEKIKTS